MSNYHNPVLAAESIAGLHIKPEGIYADVTLGGGGHSRLILHHLNENGRLFGFDQDPDAWAQAPDDSRFSLVQQNFKYLKNSLRMFGVRQVDGILADLGVSSHQFDSGERGFSIRFDGPLDMRMNQHAATSAADIVNEWEREELIRIFRQYGELREAVQMADVIVSARSVSQIATTGQLCKLVEKIERRGAKRQAQVFQALRIAVNKELEALEALLHQGLEVLAPGGRFVVISYHSLEDRMVKRFFKTGNLQGEEKKDFFGNKLTPFKEISRKAIVPTDAEVIENPRARSAKMRIVEKL
jgi:16S rRNA (cytosine1402-N4)-methyltransferase